MVKVEYSIQPLESSQISTLNVIAVYKAVLSSKEAVGGAASSAPIKTWLTIDKAQKLAEDNMLLKPQLILECLSTIEQGGGVAKEKGGAVLQYVEREMCWEDRVFQQAEYGPTGKIFIV